MDNLRPVVGQTTQNSFTPTSAEQTDYYNYYIANGSNYYVHNDGVSLSKADLDQYQKEEDQKRVDANARYLNSDGSINQAVYAADLFSALLGGSQSDREHTASVMYGIYGGADTGSTSYEVTDSGPCVGPYTSEESQAVVGPTATEATAKTETEAKEADDKNADKTDSSKKSLGLLYKNDKKTDDTEDAAAEKTVDNSAANDLAYAAQNSAKEAVAAANIFATGSFKIDSAVGTAKASAAEAIAAAESGDYSGAAAAADRAAGAANDAESLAKKALAKEQAKDAK